MNAITFLLLALGLQQQVSGFVISQNKSPLNQLQQQTTPTKVFSAEEESSENAVVELSDETSSTPEAENKGPQGPLFISQGELDPDALNPDLTNAKQTRVLIYTILSILPVLFLIPFMLSREFIPADVMPPVEMN